MSLGGFAKTFIGTATGGLIGNSSYKENLANLYSGNWDPKNDSNPEGKTPEQITTANLFKNLSPEQQKDLLINNPNIETASGKQYYDPTTNTIKLQESNFQTGQRQRQERLAEQLSGSLNGSLPSNNEEIQNATFNRGKALLDPGFKQDRRDLMQQLADQGLPIGSEAYTQALDRLDQSQGKQLVDLSQASIATAEAQRQQRFNEISSLLGNAQIGGVGFSQFQPQASGLDLFGAEQANIQMTNNNTNLNKQLKQSNRNAMYQALGSLGGAGIGAAAMASDQNLKENIKHISFSPSGIPICEFEYKNKNFGKGRYVGVMAQDVEKIIPEAVITTDEGYKMVDYSMIDVNFRRIN